MAEPNDTKPTPLQESLAKAKADQALTKAQDQEWMQLLKDFDWKHVPPHQMAVVLTKKPFRGKGGASEYLTPPQALMFAMRCFELGLSPLSSEVWFNKDNWTVNVTTEGKRKLARLQGLDLGACSKERLEREFPSLASDRVVALKVAGFTKDVGYKGRLPVFSKSREQVVEYTAWLSEWYMDRSPVWQERPEHMLQVRCEEKCITFASGIGISEMPDEREIEPEVPAAPSITVEPMDYKPPEEPKKE